jgi:transcriptional antiterminator RfaH
MNSDAAAGAEAVLPQAEVERGGVLRLELAWYAVQVKRHDEQRVVRALALRGIPSFCPTIEVMRHYRTRRVTKLEPLFPNYLFVQMAPVPVNPGGWCVVRWTSGVRCVLGTDDLPIPVPDEVIRAIQARVRDLGFVRPSPRFSAGSRVRFRHGPLVGLEAVFERGMSKTGRVRVLLSLLGQPRGVAVDELDLDPA